MAIVHYIHIYISTGSVAGLPVTMWLLVGFALGYSMAPGYSVALSCSVAPSYSVEA